MDLKLNISKQGLSTTTETINEEFTLHYGHIFRGLTAYEQAVNGGFEGTEEEYEAYVGNIGILSEDAKTATNRANTAATDARDATQNANRATTNANESASNAAAATKAARDATDRVEEKIIEAYGAASEAYGAASEARDAAEDARDAIANFEKKYDDFVLKEQGKGLSTNDYTNADKAEVEKVKDKQDTLTLTTKSNGNIVIGNLAGGSKEFMSATPSGDPMHYAYEAAGAVWDANTGYWELNDLKDITNEEMSYIYSVGRLQLSPGFLVNSINKARTNTPRLGYDNTTFSLYGFAWENSYIETINLTLYPQTIYWEGYIYSDNSNQAFENSPNLKSIFGKLVLTGSVTGMFRGCTSLQRVRVHELNRDLSFADSPLLSKESLLYMINNCASDVSFTITLHPDVYKKCYGEWVEEFEGALGKVESDKQTNIRLESA